MSRCWLRWLIVRRILLRPLWCSVERSVSDGAIRNYRLYFVKNRASREQWSQEKNRCGYLDPSISFSYSLQSHIKQCSLTCNLESLPFKAKIVITSITRTSKEPGCTLSSHRRNEEIVHRNSVQQWSAIIARRHRFRFWLWTLSMEDMLRFTEMFLLSFKCSYVRSKNPKQRIRVLNDCLVSLV